MSGQRGFPGRDTPGAPEGACEGARWGGFSSCLCMFCHLHASHHQERRHATTEQHGGEAGTNTLLLLSMLLSGASPCIVPPPPDFLAYTNCTVGAKIASGVTCDAACVPGMTLNGSALYDGVCKRGNFTLPSGKCGESALGGVCV